MLRNPGCLSRILILFIPDPGSKNSNKRRVKKICCPNFFCNHKYHKIKNDFIFEQVKKNFGPIYEKEFYPKKGH